MSAVWTAVGSTFVPDEGSIVVYEANAGRFRHKGSHTEDIYGRCNVTNPLDNGQSPGWNAMEVVYFLQDSTSQVTVQLIWVSNETGGVNTIVTFDSAAFGVHTAHPEASRVELVDIPLSGNVFDFWRYAYYVQIKVRRGSTADGNRPAVAVVRLLQIVE
jgi:hypothetical protein